MFRSLVMPLCILFFSLVTSVAQAQGIDLTKSPWVVDGADGVNWDGSDLVFTSQIANGADFDLQGYFNWNSHGAFYGRELFTGTFFANKSLHLVGFQHVDFVCCILLSTYDAEVTEAGNRIVNGSWPGGHWTATTVPEPASYTLALAGLLVLWLRSKQLTA